MGDHVGSSDERQVLTVGDTCPNAGLQGLYGEGYCHRCTVVVYRCGGGTVGGLHGNKASGLFTSNSAIQTAIDIYTLHHDHTSNKRQPATANISRAGDKLFHRKEEDVATARLRVTSSTQTECEAQ